MSKLQNEHGAALVLTLSLITLLLLFIMTLFYQVSNTTKQIVIMEDNMDATNIAEMGIDYYQYHFEENRDLFQQVVDEGSIQDLISEINTLNDTLSGVKVIEDGNRYFELVLPTLHYTSTDDLEEIVIEFDSIGTARGKEVVENSSVTIALTQN
ncbi:hypothetical protein SAMN05216389_111151 [Oceanobacillus limi]|uniref:Type 4 fimbrial biogenesis protein PilX N-terminal domain-containing protein n=1 Tax=Oceanobacillus limi TaxID=930131 RepID=A0A1I0EIR2_9BACI|nr:hypothetical protein [Oceanobacillus limi]SET45073.1 hypothetical protein SAMN05216389_111151 [Oceanobacillus limi]